MKLKAKSLLSGILSVSMLVSLVPTSAFAKTEPISGQSEISFSAAKYTVAENEKKLKVKIVRSGGNDREAQVAFKVADFTAEYGTDYVVLDSDGNELALTEGIVPDEGDFNETSNGGVISETTEETDDAFLTDASDDVEIEEEIDETETVINEDGEVEELSNVIEDDGSDEPADTPKRASTGSSLLDAQAAYLNLPDTDSEVSSAIEDTLTSVNDYFQNAQGAVGVVTFGVGEIEKEITIKPIDNDKPQADKIFIMSLMGINGDDEATLSANPTAYVNIIDDEKYETPVIEPNTSEIALSEENPTYELVLSRTAGVDYYTSVTVSTVKETAQEGYNYEKIEDASVSFAPGETEKKVKISAENFNEEMSFGIRLESDGTCDISNEYIRVIMQEKIDKSAAELMSEDETAELMGNIVLGKAQTSIKLDYLGLKAGPSTGSQDGSHYTSYNSDGAWTDYCLYETYKNSGRTWVAIRGMYLAGVDSIALWHMNNGEYKGSYAAYHSFAELMSRGDKNNWDKYGATYSRWDGSHGWQQATIDTSSLNDLYYLRLGIKNDGYTSDNARGGFGNPLYVNWHKYNISINNLQVFNRFIYNYDDKTGATSKIPYTDDGDDYDYRPTAKLVDSKNNTVTGFYANAGEVIKPVSNNPKLDAKYGVELEGVYIYTKDSGTLYKKDPSAPYTDHWYTDKTIWIPASGVLVNQDFAAKLFSTFGNSDIKVTPKFKQTTVTLNIYNIDNANTYIANLNNKNTKAASYCDWGKKGYYNQYYFPKYSKIKVRAVAAKGKTVTGFNVDLWSTTNDPVVSDSNAPEKMTYALTENMGFYPRTEDQGLTISYMPGATKVISNLTGRVITQPSLLDSADDISSTDSSGNMNIQPVYSGMNWTMRATAPDGYYVKWTNGTGDIKTVNGKIDVNSNPNINEETENTKKFASSYVPVYGDILAGTILQSNTKYYYEFVKNDNSNSEILGNVKRENSTFYDLVYNNSTSSKPVAATQISVAGTSTYTDQNGDFAIKLKNVPTSGFVSVIVDDDGTMYPTTALANYMSITLPAYQCFKPSAITVKYNNSTTNKISGTAVNIKDDTLNIITKVENKGTLEPMKAKYYIHKTNGTVIDCSTDSRFTNSFENRTATMSFNPKSIMDSGDEIYVAYIDQNDKEYKAINLGYDFVAPLNLQTFIFPLIGSSLLSNAYSDATELIGNPLGDMSLGKLNFNEPESDYVTPDGMDPEKYKYLRTTYQFGDYSKALKTFKSDDSKDKDKDKNKDKDKKTADKSKEAVKDAGKATEDGGYKTAKSFSWEFSPKLVFAMQLTTRKDGNQYKYYFEELDFIVGADYKVSGKITVTLPIGMDIIITGELSGDVTGIYQLKTNYTGDSTWNNNKVEYSADTFGLFKEVPNVDRKAYLMINPNIKLGLAVKYAIVEVGGNANFKFDMDFEFTLNKGSLGDRYYGDMTYNFDYYIKVLSFNVYSGKSKERTVKLFSENADGHIEPDIISGLMSMNGTEIQSEQTTRAYLNNASAWNTLEDDVSLMDINAQNTTESKLQSGVYPSAKTTLTSLGNNKIFMTFIGDVSSRSDVNRTGLYYSIYNGTKWSTPKLIDDDGTLDDYPDVFDLGDKLLISWSSADSELEDDATTTQALTALDIKTVFFDKATETFGTVTQLTHTTDEDYTADVEPKAAYDSETDRVILYYTKTEYTDAEELTDLLDAPSVIAYRFYENGEWNGADYTDEELEGVEDTDDYKTQWYGQRFLDIRLDKTSDDMLRIIDSDAISYNGLSLYAWVVDYDKDLNTVDDRDVFLQIYNFEENSFTHIIKMTPNSGAYTAPHFGRYNNETYLFYSSLGALDGSEDDEQSGIAYFAVSDIIKNDKYTLVNENSTEYYKLEYTTTIPESETNEGLTIPAHDETVQIQPSYAVTTDGYINNYSVDIDENEKMYLTWTNSDENGSRQIYTSIFDTAPQVDDDEKSDGLSYAWSEPFKLTDVENTAYANADSAVINGKLYITASKTPYVDSENGQSLDETNASLVMLVHTPYSKPVTVEENALAISTNYVYPNEGFTLTSTVKNEGTKYIDSPVTFKFTMKSNGKTTELGEQTVDSVWGAGKTISASVDVPAIEEISGNLTFNAVVTIGEGKDATVIKQEYKAVKEYNIILDGDATVEEFADGHKLNLTLRNDGNISSKAVNVTLYTSNNGEKGDVLGKYTIDSIEANSSYTLEEDAEIPDSVYTIDGADGTADVIAAIEIDGKEIYTLEASVHQTFDADAIATLKNVTGVTIVGDSKLTAEYMDDIEIATEIAGTAGDDVTVKWISDDNDVVYVRDDNTLYAAGEGKATLTGYVVPSGQNIVFGADGYAEEVDILEGIPSTMYNTVTAEVTVEDPNATPAPTKKSSSGRGGSSKSSSTVATATPTPTETTEPTTEPTATTKPTTEPSTNGNASFSDVTAHWAKDYIEKLAGENIVKGVSNGIFEPDGEITRAQFAQLLMNTGLVEAGDIAIPRFTDVADNAWYNEAVTWAVSCGVAKGMSDEIFEPDSVITREQMAAMVNRFISLADIKTETINAVSFTDADSISDWAKADVETLAGIGVIKGRDNGAFDPKANMTRAESTVVIYNILSEREGK